MYGKNNTNIKQAYLGSEWLVFNPHLKLIKYCKKWNGLGCFPVRDSQLVNRPFVYKTRKMYDKPIHRCNSWILLLSFHIFNGSQHFALCGYWNEHGHFQSLNYDTRDASCCVHLCVRRRQVPHPEVFTSPQWIMQWLHSWMLNLRDTVDKRAGTIPGSISPIPTVCFFLPSILYHCCLCKSH